MDLIDLREAYCESPDFKHLAIPFHYYVPGRGAERPVAMVLGTAPGSAENADRKTFVGQLGRVLDQLLDLAGLRAEPEYELAPSGERCQETAPANTYLTNMIKYRIGRFPLKDEMDKSSKWVRKEWGILGKPKLIITLGAAPYILLKGKVGRPEDIGYPFTSRFGAIAYPMIHPEVPLYNPSIRPVAEEHWQALGAWLKEEGLA